MQRTLKALSALLDYPSAELIAAADEIGAALAQEGSLSIPQRLALARLAEEIGRGDLLDLQESYVNLFDRSRTLSLNLFEHVHGESRDRGGAMVSLVELYRAAGFEPAGWALPDHLPMLLEFLSTRERADAQETLRDAAHILAALETRLARRGSAYAAVFGALVALSAAEPDAGAVRAALSAPDDDPDDLEALDAAWEEAAVTFGPDPSAGCPAARDTLARMTPTARDTLARMTPTARDTLARMDQRVAPPARHAAE